MLFALIKQLIDMNSSKQFLQVGRQGILTKSILTEKKFQLSNIEWKYENNFQLSLLLEDQSSKLSIKNHLCQMNDNKIKKITQITFKDKKYVIEDIYSIQLPQNLVQIVPEQMQRESKDGASTNDSDKNENKEKHDDKKVYIFKKIRKRKMNAQDNEQHLRNTKNVSKNFCKAFISYLKSDKSNTFQRKRVRDAIKTYNSMLEEKKYNNNLIKRIICNPTLSEIFRHFLQTQASNWINDSRVNDKKLHYEAIEVYLQLFVALSDNQQIQIQDQYEDDEDEDSANNDAQVEKQNQQREEHDV